MLGLGFQLQLRCTHEHKIQLKHELSAPIPRAAVKGIEGMQVADRVLKEYGVVGMLIGGLAKELWQGHFDEKRLNAHKDVDVIVLSHDCCRHPLQHEHGVDWWVSHNNEERPTNGYDIGLIWRVQLDKHAQKIVPGLYLCPPDLLSDSVRQERQAFKTLRIHGCRFSKKEPTLYPVLHSMQLQWSWGSAATTKADHCKIRQ